MLRFRVDIDCEQLAGNTHTTNRAVIAYLLGQAAAEISNRRALPSSSGTLTSPSGRACGSWEYSSGLARDDLVCAGRNLFAAIDEIDAEGLMKAKDRMLEALAPFDEVTC